MTDQTLNNICMMGAFPNTHIYHICGLPWAATNSVEFARWIKTNSTTQNTLRAQLFGDDSDNVQVLPILDIDLGSQKIDYSENKGINVAGWSVKIHGANAGFVWKNETNMEQWGLIGLDWQPTENTFGAGHSMLSADVIPDLDNDNEVTIQWDKNKNFGLSAWLDDNWEPPNGVAGHYLHDIYFYVGSSCLRPTGEIVDGGDYWSVVCESGKLNAPVEDILALRNGQNIFVSNYPQGIEGLTANLYSVMFKDDNLISGTTPYFMRTGKVKPNATNDSSGNWSISMGGFTDQFKFSNTIGSYKGNLTGFQFNSNDWEGGFYDSSYQYHTPLLTIQEVYEDAPTGTIKAATIEISGNFQEYSSPDDIIDYLVEQLNLASLTLTYSRSGDDIVYDSSASAYDVSYVTINGLAPFVAGIGYTCTKTGFEYYLNAITDPVNSNFCYFTEDDTVVNSGYFFLRNKEADYLDVLYSSLEAFPVPIIIKTKPLDYFYQYDLDLEKRDGTNYEYYKTPIGSVVPKNSSGTQTLTVITSGASHIELQEGMKIQFGNFADTQEGLGIYGEVYSVTGEDITFLSNRITGMPTGIYSCSSVLDAIYEDPDYLAQISLFAEQSGITIDDVIAKFSGDLFEIKDIENLSIEEGGDLFRAILGDPDTDTGFSVGAVKTDIKNLFQRGDSNFVPMFNWDKFEALLEANKIQGCKFKYTPSSNGVDVLALLAGVCLTYNIQMIWEYNSDYRCWWLTFDDFGNGNGTTATLAGREIKTEDISSNSITAVAGGGWYYNKLSAKYQSTEGGDIPLNYQLTDGRVGHSLHDRTLTIDDKVTLLPVDSASAQADIIKHFTAMARLFSQIVYKQKLILNVRKTAVLGVGRWSTVDWAPVQNRQTGRRNDGDLIGQLQSMDINLSSAIIGVDILSYPAKKAGISPSLYPSTVSVISNTVTLSGLSIYPTSNNFGDKDNILTDLMYFGCLNNVAGVLTDRACNCNGYRVTIFERYPDSEDLFFDVDYLFKGQNVFRGTMDKLTTDSDFSTVDIELDGGGDLFDVKKDYVVTFADRADEDLQPCQTQFYGWLADSDNLVVDSDDNYTTGIQVGN